MNHKWLSAICISLFVTITVIAKNAAHQKESSYRYETYEVVSQRNIFSRNRQSVKVDNGDVPVRKQQVVLTLYVLKGVAVNGSRKVAFIEEEVSGESIKGRVGTELLNGKIENIGFDHVVFKDNGISRQIVIGDIFGKTESITDIQVDPEAPSPSIEDTESSDDASSDEDELLKKMMERRTNELGT